MLVEIVFSLGESRISNLSHPLCLELFKKFVVVGGGSWVSLCKSSDLLWPSSWPCFGLWAEPIKNDHNGSVLNNPSAVQILCNTVHNS